MCGICGIYYRNGVKRADLGEITRMTGTIIHRGPDEDGFYVNGNVAMGMRRLSIIDLAGGKQPISNESDDLWVVFNGEIYNYPELRQRIEQKGHRFKTRTDTEIILHCYEEYGDEFITHLRGMFGFALYDEKRKRLVLGRDRIGIKPLYLYEDDEKYIFGSEIKAILKKDGVDRTLDYQALDMFLTLEYIPAPSSIFKRIRKIQPGYMAILSEKGVEEKRYWDITNIEKLRYDDEREVFVALREQLRDAVRSHLLSDVPVGAFLSGGIDSSAIVTFMAEEYDKPIKTFSIGFDDASYNELPYAKRIAEKCGTEHHEYILEPDIVRIVEELIGYIDEPFGDFSIFPTFLVSKVAREHLKVVLSGDGGDELFAGYDTYIADKLYGYYRKLPGVARNLFDQAAKAISPTSQKKGMVNILKRYLEGAELPEKLHHARWMIFLNEVEKTHLYTRELLPQLDFEETYAAIVRCFERAEYGDKLDRELYVDLKTYLSDDILVKVDRMSMANSLEARVPYLDHRVVEFSFSIPAHLKMKNYKRKYVLKKSMEGILPDEILTKKKQGFSIPIKNWLKNELKPMMHDVLNRESVTRDGLFNWDYIEKTIEDHLSGRANNSHKLWALMVFQMWKKTYAE
jgi:asparagine synthase (glutamine-hydrolysing)